MADWLDSFTLEWLFILEEMVFLAILIGIIWFINRLYSSPSRQSTIIPWTFISLGIGMAVGWYCYLFLPYSLADGNRLAYMVWGVGGFGGILMLAPAKFGWHQPLFQQRILILTDYGTDMPLPPEILKPASPRYRIMGILNDDPSLKGKRLRGVEVLGNSSDLSQIATRLRIHQVVVAIGQQRGQLPFNVLLDCRLKGIKVLELADFYERVTGRMQLQNSRPSRLIFQPGFNPSLTRIYIKRLLDVLLSSLGLLMGLPCWIVVWFIRIGWGNKVLVAFPRVGEKGQEFNMFTFSPEIQQGLVGEIFRALHMDKLPALINVLRGEMSLVGPHPDKPELATKYEHLLPYYDKRFNIKPGLLSWAMVNQVNGSNHHDLQQRWQSDLYYAKRASLWLDFKIGWRAIKLFVGGKKVNSMGYEGVPQC